MPTKYYLITVFGDIEPELSGPYPSEHERDAAAVAHRRQDSEKEDGLFRLNIVDGEPEIDTFRGGVLEWPQIGEQVTADLFGHSRTGTVTDITWDQELGEAMYKVDFGDVYDSTSFVISQLDEPEEPTATDVTQD